MKKLAALCLMLSFTFVGVALADHLTKLKKTEMSGTITAYTDDKSVTIKDDKGKESTLAMDPETKVMGTDGKATDDNNIKKDGKVKIQGVQVDNKWVAAEIWLQ